MWLVTFDCAFLCRPIFNNSTKKCVVRLKIVNWFKFRIGAEKKKTSQTLYGFNDQHCLLSSQNWFTTSTRWDWKFLLKTTTDGHPCLACWWCHTLNHLNLIAQILQIESQMSSYAVMKCITSQPKYLPVHRGSPIDIYVKSKIQNG